MNKVEAIIRPEKLNDVKETAPVVPAIYSKTVTIMGVTSIASSAAII